MKTTKALLAIVLVFSFLTTACAEDVNIKDKKLVYVRSKVDSPNALIAIWFVLKELPSDVKTIYVENIVFTYKSGWTPPEKYLSPAFDIQTGNPHRFAFYRVYSDEVWFTTSVLDALLNVDEWIERNSCPFRKIQLQGFSASAPVALPDKLDISFRCNLDFIKECPRNDFSGGCIQ